MLSFLGPIQELIFVIDDLIFGRRKPDYSPAQHMVTIPVIGGIILAFFFLIIIFFMNVSQDYALKMCYWLMGGIISLNIILCSWHVFILHNIFSKIGYIIFCGTVSAIFLVLTFALMTLILLILIVIFTLKFLINAAFEQDKHTSFGGFGGRGGNGSFDGGGSFVRKDQKAYDLSNGDQVEFSPMTGNYVSTNPLFPREYEKNGNDFIEL